MPTKKLDGREHQKIENRDADARIATAELPLDWIIVQQQRAAYQVKALQL